MADKPVSFSSLLAGKPPPREAPTDATPTPPAPARETAAPQSTAEQATVSEPVAAPAPISPAHAHTVAVDPAPAAVANALEAPSGSASAYRAATPGQGRPSRPEAVSRPTLARQAVSGQAPALPAIAYQVENIDRLRDYVARQHWVDDVLFPQLKLDVYEQALLRRIVRLTLGWGRIFALCGNETMCRNTGMGETQLARTRAKLIGRGLIETEFRIHGPVTERGVIYRLLPSAIPPDALPAILDACEKASAPTVQAPSRQGRAGRATAVPGAMKGNESEVSKWTVDRLQTIAVQMIDDARIDGDEKPTSAQIERELRTTLRRVGAQAGIDFQDPDVIAIAKKWGREE